MLSLFLQDFMQKNGVHNWPYVDDNPDKPEYADCKWYNEVLSSREQDVILAIDKLYPLDTKKAGPEEVLAL